MKLEKKMDPFGKKEKKKKKKEAKWLLILHRHCKMGQIFLTQPKNTRSKPDFFDLKQKWVDP